MNTYPTILNLDDYRKGNFPICLDDAVSILVSQEENKIPFGADIEAIFQYEAAIKSCDNQGNKYQAKILEKEITDIIKEQITNITSRLYGLANFGYTGYVTAFTHSKPIPKENFPITKSNNSSFQFEIHPHLFNLGYTGRIISDGEQAFQEELHVNCSIYDAFDLALQMSPKSVFARMKNGSIRLLKKGTDRIGEYEDIKKIDEEVTLAFSEMNNWRIKPKLLENQDGLKVILSTEWNKLTEKYDDESSIMFGTELQYRTILEKGLETGYLFWKIAQNSKRDPCITPMGTFLGSFLRSDKFPEEIDRYQILTNNAYINFGKVRIQYGKSSAYNSLLAIKDQINDIWMSVFLSEQEIMHEKTKTYLTKHNLTLSGDYYTDLVSFFGLNPPSEVIQAQIPKWDIIYDKKAGITHLNPVQVRDDETAIQYAVRR